MKSKRLPVMAIALVIAAVCAVGVMMTAFATESTRTDEPATAAQETIQAAAQEATPEIAEEQEPTKTVDESAKTDTPEKKATTDKSGKTFIGIDAVAAEVLGVSEESLTGLNHADQLYAELAKAGKVEEFKAALIAAKQAKFDSMAGGKLSAEQIEEKLSSYKQMINDWDGTKELTIGFMKNKAK